MDQFKLNMLSLGQTTEVQNGVSCGITAT